MRFRSIDREDISPMGAVDCVHLHSVEIMRVITSLTVTHTRVHSFAFALRNSQSREEAKAIIYHSTFYFKP